MGRGQWTPDGAFFLFTAWSSAFSQNPIFSQNLNTQIWALDERRSWWHPRHPEPIQLTSGASSWGTGYFALSKDGTSIYTTGVSSRGELVVHDLKSDELKPYLGGISAEYVDFSKDGRRIVYVTYPEGIMWSVNRDGTGLMQLTNPPIYPVAPRWAPDGAQIAFFDGSGREPTIYTIPSQGGTPKRLLHGDPKGQTDPNWSPDGKRIVFTESTGTIISASAAPTTHVLELASGKIADLPPSPRDFVSPRWSPDGRYIAGMTLLHDDLELFDLWTKRWSLVGLGRGYACNWLAWSHDGRFIYFVNEDWYIFKSSDPGVYRVSISGGKPEKVVDLKGFTGAGFYGGWFGLDPDDSPLLLRNAGTREIFALTLERK
jgi:Tol biopolymer transport system component